RMAELALLVKLLPEEIRRRVDKKEYAEVLVLARQHRELFKKGWIDPAFLMDIAAAYQHIGIFGEAQKLYLYLIETVPVDKKEQYYLPMIEACLNNGNYGLVDEYAAQYSYNYPHGTYSDQILFRRLQALVAYESFTEALNLVPTPLPRHNGICSIAAALFYQKDNYRKSSELYELLSESDYSFSESDLIMYGESLFQTGHYDQAENVYLQIDGNSPFFNQSLYRLSEIERRKGDEENSLRFLGKIVDTGNKDLWQRYALEELQYAETTAYIKSISPAIQMTPVIETAENRD
ncbi:MAG: hypothetical protein JRC87_12035, partial [Deltaproteobacteria bacterium]|nr:hypothetical protein [Deltaproteobacteria bacterium]